LLPHNIVSFVGKKFKHEMSLSRHKYFLIQIPFSAESMNIYVKLNILSSLKNPIIVQTLRKSTSAKIVFLLNLFGKIRLLGISCLIIVLAVILANCSDKIEDDMVPKATDFTHKSNLVNLEIKIPVPSDFTLGKIEKDVISKNQILAYRCEIGELNDFNKLKLTLSQPSRDLKKHDWNQYNFYDDSLQNILDRLKSMNAVQTRLVKISVPQKIQKPNKQVSISQLQEQYARKLISLDSLKSGIHNSNSTKISPQNLKSKANAETTKVMIEPHINDKHYMNLLYKLNNVLDIWSNDNLITSPHSGEVISRTSDEIVIKTSN